MSVATKSSSIFGPLRSAESMSTVALRGLVTDLGPERAAEVLMDQKQKIAIGERIRELRNNSPQTNRSIADHVGIGERAVAQWLAGGGISYENAEKVSELFDVDVQWLLSGKEGGTGSQGQLDRIEAKLDDLLKNWDARWALLEADDAAPVEESVPAEPQPSRASSSKRSRAKAR